MLPRGPLATEPASPRYRLTRNFALGAALICVVAAVLVIDIQDRSRRDQLIRLAAENNADFTRTFVNTLWDRYGPHVRAARDLAPDRVRHLPVTAELEHDIARHARGLSVIKVKFYDAQGFTAFSTESAQIGGDYSANPRFLRALRGEDAAELEFRKTFNALTGPARDRWVLSSYVPIRPDAGTGAPSGVAEVYRDVTDLVARMRRNAIIDAIPVVAGLLLVFAGLVAFVWRAERAIARRHRENIELTTAMARVELASRAKSDFLASMSHELRTPLNAIIGLSQIMRDELRGPVGSSEYKSYAGDIHESGSQLLNMINDVLSYVDIDKGAVAVSLQPTDIAREVGRVMRSQTERAGGRGVRIAIDAPLGLELVETDPDRLHQILVRLVSSAVARSPQGGEVRIRVKQDAEARTRIEIRDSGTGMSQEEMVDAMTPFGQSADVLTRSSPGGTAGLGLPLAVRLAETIGGDIAIDSAPGRGTTATVTLPPRAATSRPRVGFHPRTPLSTTIH